MRSKKWVSQMYAFGMRSKKWVSQMYASDLRRLRSTAPEVRCSMARDQKKWVSQMYASDLRRLRSTAPEVRRSLARDQKSGCLRCTPPICGVSDLRRPKCAAPWHTIKKVGVSDVRGLIRRRRVGSEEGVVAVGRISDGGGRFFGKG